MDGSEIKNLRRILNLNQRELAKKLDVSQATIAQWEKGLKNPGRKNQTELERLSASIHLSPKETWQSRKPIFQIARDNKPYTIDLGLEGEQLVPMVLIRIPDTIDTFIEDPNNGNNFVYNPKHKEYQVFYKVELGMLNLIMGEDYEYFSIEREVFITALNQKTWDLLKPWDLDNDEIIKLWLNRDNI